MEKFFYLNRGGRLSGPFSAARLIAMRRAGQLDSADRLSTDRSVWRPVTTFDWLYECVPAPPPLRRVPVVSAAGAAAAVPPEAEREDVSAAEIVAMKPPAVIAAEDMPAGGEEVSSGERIAPQESVAAPGSPLFAAGEVPEPDPLRLGGYTLGLIWNTADYLPKLRQYGAVGVATAGCFGTLAALLAATAASAAAAPLFPGTVSRFEAFLSGGGAVLGLALLLFLEQFCCRVFLAPSTECGNCWDDWLTATAALLDFVAFGVIALALLPAAGRGWWPLVWPLLLFACCFALSNILTALRFEYGRICGIRPRFATLVAALTLWIPATGVMWVLVKVYGGKG